MKLSTSTCLHKMQDDNGRLFSPAEILSAFKRAGYDSVDIDFWSLSGPDLPMWGDDWEKTVEDFGEASADLQLPVWQTHSDSYLGTQWDDPKFPYHEERRRSIFRCIEAASRLGADCVVMHPYNKKMVGEYSSAENRAAAIAFLAPYIEAAKKAGVRIAIENLTNFGDGRRRHCGGPIEELIDLVDAINDPDVGICIDTGHANIAGLNAAEALRASGSRVIALHINDNYASLKSDLHQVPFMGGVNWPDVMRALTEIGYKGHFTYELGVLKRCPDALYQDWLNYTVKVGRGLIAMLDEANG